MSKTKIAVIFHDITKVDFVEAIIVPANCFMLMRGGLAGQIIAKGGESIEKEAMAKAPVPIGTSIVTSSGLLDCRFLIHSPTVSRPVEASTQQNIRKATLSALVAADAYVIRSVAVPALGAGTGGVPYNEVARAIVQEIIDYLTKNPNSCIEEIYLVIKPGNWELYKCFLEETREC